MKSRPEMFMRLSENDADQDRLSDLPDEVLLHILSLMPTLDAVRTMLLRRFGDLWTFVAALRFDFVNYRDSLISNKYRGEFCFFVNFIQKVLMLHRRATIDTFHFTVYDPDRPQFHNPIRSADVQMWLRFATAKKAKDLSVGYHRLLDELAPPPCVLQNQVLSTLKLSHCVLDSVHQVHMGALNKLSLTRVKLNNEAISRLISGCPSLQELVIDSAWGPQTLNITSRTVSKLDLDLGFLDYPCTLNFPNLKVLKFAVRFSPFQLDVINVSSLQDVTVKKLPYTCPPSLLTAFLMNFRNAEVLTFSYGAFEGLSCLKQSGFPQNKWKRLVLQPFRDFKTNLQVIFQSVKSSASLEELIIHVFDLSVDCELHSSDDSSCVMPLLRTVGIYAYGKLCEGHLQLVEILLRSAVVLEKLVITFGKYKVTAAEEFNFIKQVSGFRRASANAIVDFICLDNIVIGDKFRA